MIKNFAKFSCVLNIVEVSISSLSESDRGRFFCEGCHDCRLYVSTVMRFTRLGALQGDVIWKWSDFGGTTEVNVSKSVLVLTRS